MTPTQPSSSEGRWRIRTTARTPCGNSSWVRSKTWSYAVYWSLPDLELQAKKELERRGIVALWPNSCWLCFFHIFFLFALFSDNDFWFPLNSSASGPVPPCAGGHSATYDPNSKSIFVYGGLREGQRYSELYILDTLTWSWRLVNVGFFFASFQNVVFLNTINRGGGNCFSLICSANLFCQLIGQRKCPKIGIPLCSLLQEGAFCLWRSSAEPFLRR